MEVLVQAVRYGAVVCNHVVATDLEGGEDLCRAVVQDGDTGDSFEVHARRVISAAGVWGDRVESLAVAGREPRMRPSKGVHLTFDRSRLPMGEAAAFIPDAERKRMLFVIPWLDSVIVGTTDTPYEGDIDTPSVEPEDRRYCIDALNSVFHLDLKDEDISGAWAGLRPLIAGKGGSTADLSRNHRVYDIAPGIRGITGGKLTTYRRMAKDAVDHVASDLGNHVKPKTRWIRLGTANLSALRFAVRRRGQRLRLSDDVVANLVRCYGDRALSVLDLAEKNDLGQNLVPGLQPIAAEAVYCARHEMAVHLPDLLARRTRLALTDPAAGIGPHSVAPEIMGAELGWDEAEIAAQTSIHRAEVEQERTMPLQHELGPRSGGEQLRSG